MDVEAASKWDLFLKMSGREKHTVKIYYKNDFLTYLASFFKQFQEVCTLYYYNKKHTSWNCLKRLPKYVKK